MSFYIGFCVANEQDGSQEELEIAVDAGTDEEAVTVFENWREVNTTEYRGTKIIGEPKLYFVRRVA